MIISEKEYLLNRLEEIQKEIDAPRPSACMDWRHDDYDNKNGSGSYWGKLYVERDMIIRKLGKDKPYRYYTSNEKLQKQGKSSILLAQEHAAIACQQSEELKVVESSNG